APDEQRQQHRHLQHVAHHPLNLLDGCIIRKGIREGVGRDLTLRRKSPTLASADAQGQGAGQSPAPPVLSRPTHGEGQSNRSPGRKAGGSAAETKKKRWSEGKVIAANKCSTRGCRTR